MPSVSLWWMSSARPYISFRLPLSLIASHHLFSFRIISFLLVHVSSHTLTFIHITRRDTLLPIAPSLPISRRVSVSWKDTYFPPTVFPNWLSSSIAGMKNRAEIAVTGYHALDGKATWINTEAYGGSDCCRWRSHQVLRTEIWRFWHQLKNKWTLLPVEWRILGLVVFDGS